MALLDAFFPALHDEDKLTVLYWDGEVFPLRQIDHPAIDYRAMRYAARSFRGERELNAAVQRLQPDVYWSADPVVRPPQTPRAKRLYTAFSMELLSSLSEELRFKWWELLRWQRTSSQSLEIADVLFCPSHTFAVALIAQLGLNTRRRAVVIPNGVHPIFRRHTDEEVTQIRRKFLLPKRYVLMVGTSSVIERLATPLQALAQCEEVSSLPCVIVGDRGLPDALRETIRDCHLEGLVKCFVEDEIPLAELSTLYSGAMVTFEPMQSANYRLTVLRSMACGTPVICAASAVTEELYGNAVLRVHPTDVTEWVKAFTAVMLSSVLRERQIARGVACVQERTWTTTAKMSMHILRALVEGRATKNLNKLLQ